MKKKELKEKVVRLGLNEMSKIQGGRLVRNLPEVVVTAPKPKHKEKD